ncbi:MAG: hypothetical protein V8S24_13685 [Gordonibacter pamelaeae]
MLQQTQVARVGRFWERFMALFPTIDALASADTSDVLAQWQGLGYNRRALALKRTADLCAAERAGSCPPRPRSWCSCPASARPRRPAWWRSPSTAPRSTWRRTCARCSCTSCSRTARA